MSLSDFSSPMDLFGLQRQLVFEESDRYRLFEELSQTVKELPDFWNLLWERYVDSRLDYRASEGTLREKMGQARTFGLC